MPRKQSIPRSIEEEGREEFSVTRRIAAFSFQSFDNSVSWKCYANHFERICRLKGFGSPDQSEIRKELLLAYVGTTCLAAIQNYFFPKSLDECTYSEVVNGFTAIYMPSTTIFTSRITFEQANRSVGESFMEYANRLKELSSFCSYGASLDERLRDRFVAGVGHLKFEADVRQRWPDGVDTGNKPVSFQQVFQLGLVLEKSEKETEKEKGTFSIEKVGSFSKSPPCQACGFEKHRVGRCPAEKVVCRRCSRRGHYARCCKRSAKGVRAVTTGSSRSGSEDEGEPTVVRAIETKAPRATIDVKLNGQWCRMEYDSGARVSTINRYWWEKLGCPKLSKYRGSLTGYGKKILKSLGTTNLKVELDQRTLSLPVVVMDENDGPLFGLPWSLAFELSLPKHVTVRKVGSTNSTSLNKRSQKESPLGKNITNLLNEFQDIFRPELGTVRGVKVQLHLKESAVPKAFKARRVPFSLRKPVEQELRRLESQGIIEKVDPAVTPIEWVTPTVNIDKGNGAVRICGDFRVTLNPVLAEEFYMMPTFDDLVSKLVGSTIFTVVDLRDAYLQLEVADESRKLLTIATHVGYYRYRRMCFGLTNAPARFQRFMDDLLAGISKVAVLLDDVVVGGDNMTEHLHLLKEVFARIRAAGLRLKREKCQFVQDSVQYLGHQLDREGIHPTPSKVQAIKDTPSPKTVKELRAFLGMVNFYEKFIPHLHEICADLHKLTSNKMRWRWTEKEEGVFQRIKDMLATSDNIVPYDVNKQLILRCDASEAGLGAVLLHRMEDGSERPIAFASRKLNKTEEHYASIDREALALVFGVKKFHQFVWGRKFHLISDHRPLLRIFGGKRDLPKVTNNRLIRWAILLMGYDYEVVYCKGQDNKLADSLSRLPQNSVDLSEEEELEIKSLRALRNEKIDTLTDRHLLQKETRDDQLLRRVKEFIQHGWPRKVAEDQVLRPYWLKKEELAVEEGVITRLGRFIPPNSLRKAVIKILHAGHPGIEGMRSLARYYTWWPGMDVDLELYVKRCQSCQEGRDQEPEVPLYPWNLPDAPWERVHLDLAGPFAGSQWLVGVDGLTKWPEVEMLQKTTSQVVVKKLRSWFSRWGVPKTLVTDNGPQFTSQEFKKFCSDNGIRHITSTPYHPKTNGLVERFIRTFKRRWLACKKEVGDSLLALQRFLLSYRNTPHKTTGMSPAQLFLGRRLPTLLDRVSPNFRDGVEERMWKQKAYHDRSVRPRELQAGEEVWIQSEKKDGWTAGIILKRTSDLSYEVLVQGLKKRKHADQLRRRVGAVEENPQPSS